MRRARLLTAAGIVGPAVFVADWAALGVIAKGYSPIEDAISRLAATGSPTRLAMSAGFIVYGGALAAFAAAGEATTLPKMSRLMLAATGLATFGVAAFPLDSMGRSTVHGVFAGIGYVTLSAAPLFAAKSAVSRRFARASVLIGLTGGGFLLASTFAPHHGLLQRVGLTLGDAWVAAVALHALRSSPSARRG